MSYRIVGDSCTDWTEEMKQDPHYVSVPLTLEIGDYQVIDDAHFDQKDFLRRVKESPVGPKTACPSPESFREAYTCDAEDIYVVTLSSHLSGSYNSARVGMELCQEERPDRHIKVIDSWSAAAGQTVLALMIREWCELGLSFAEVCAKIDDFVPRMKTYFVLEDLDTLRKNGRLSGMTAFIATALNIKPVMSATEGVIEKLDQCRGIKRSLTRMVDLAIAKCGDTSDRLAVISHCNNPERAAFVKGLMEQKSSFRKILITETAGVATTYAEDGGIVLAF